MKKVWQSLGLLALVLSVLVSTNRISFSRVTSADSTDVWCVGPSGAEICVDTSGNLVPTTDNDTTLGTASLRWATVNALDVTIGDDLTITDDVTVTDDLTAANIGVSTNVLTAMTLHVKAENASSSATVITAAASQTANLLTIRNSALTSLFSVGSAGAITASGALTLSGALSETANITTTASLGVSTNVVTGIGLHVVQPNASSTATVITAAASATADALQVRNSALTALVRVTKTGGLVPLIQTLAQIHARTPDAVGEILLASDASLPYSICIATGTGVDQYMVMTSTPVAVGCK